MSTIRNAAPSSPPPPGRGTKPLRIKASSQSKSDWLATSLMTAKAVTAAAECIPFPYVKGVFGTAVTILETVEKVKKNRDDLKELCENITDIIRVVQEQLLAHSDTAALRFKSLCEALESVLQNVLKAVKQLQTREQGLSGRLKEVMKLGSTADEISGYRTKIQELRLNFMLGTTIDIHMKVDKALSTAAPLNQLAPQIPQTITKCPPPSRIFHGRQQILDEMHKLFKQDLNQQHIFLLHGLGGAGKTQIALKFIQESSSRFSEIFLIDASTLETIDTGLSNIAATKDAGSTAQDALQWLRSQPNEWLLLFDNADDPKINLHKFFPQSTHGNILITSRNPGLRVYAGSYALVSDMEETDAVELLLKSAAVASTPANKDTATEIVKALCYLPLAIIQAGAFISQSGALDQYLDLYTENQAQLLSEKPVQSHDNYAWTVYTTWQISFDQLSKLAATFLQLCSFLHHEGISEQIFSRASGYRFPAYCPSREELEQPLEFLSQFLGPWGIWDPLIFRKVTNEIQAYSLINFGAERNMFSIHPLVHTWCQSTLTDQQSYHYWTTAVVGMSISEIRDENVQLASLELLPHLDSLIGGGTTPDFRSEYGWVYLWAGRWKDAKRLLLGVLVYHRNLLGEDHPYTLFVMARQARAHWIGDEFKEAEDLEVAVLKKRRQILGEDHPDTLDTMANLGSTYHKLGQFQKAEELQVLVLEKRRKILGEEHSDTLLSMANLGATYHYLGQLKEAAELHVLVLEKRRKILGEDHPDTLRAMGNLGSTYCALGQLKEAEKLAVVVLEKRRNILGEDHPDTLLSMANLRSTYHKLGQFNEAEKLEVVVLEKRRKILGENHPDTLLAMANLGSTYHRLGQFNEAEKLEVVVLEKRRKILGENHPDTLVAMANWGSTYHKVGQLKEAEELDVGVLEKRRKILGEDHPDTLLAMANLGSTYHKLGQFREAEALEVVVLKKRRNIPGEDHPDTLFTMANLGSTYHKLGRFKEAVQLEAGVFKRRRKVLGEDHPDTLLSMASLGSTYHKLGRFNQAEELEVDVLEKRRKIFGEDHPDTLLAMANLGSTYHKLGQFKEAEKLDIFVLDKRRKILGEDHPDTLSAMANLGSTYRQLGQLKEAEELEVDVLEKRRKIFKEDHPDALSAMKNLAATYYHQDHFAQAEQLLIELLNKQKNILGDDHPDTLDTAKYLAQTRQALANSAE